MPSAAITAKWIVRCVVVLPGIDHAVVVVIVAKNKVIGIDEIGEKRLQIVWLVVAVDVRIDNAIIVRV